MHHRNWPWLGLVLGLLTAVGDLVFIKYGMGAHFDIAGSDATLEVMAGFALTYAVLGYALGRVWADRRVIADQLQALRDSQDQLLQYEKLASIGRMAAGVAHEVRNPLGVIRSSASLIAEDLGDADPETLRACTFIQEEIDRLDGFVAALLDFSRPIQSDATSLDLDRLLDRVQQLAAEAREVHGFALTVQTEVSGAHRADEDLLVRALLTLIINAGQAVDPGGSVVVKVHDRDGDLTFQVIDDGPGVTEPDKVFEPFYTTRADGTGLGLAMATRIAEAHGGQLTVVNTGQGATFSLVVPRLAERRAA